MNVHVGIKFYFQNQAMEYENKLHKLQQLVDERDTELVFIVGCLF